MTIDKQHVIDFIKSLGDSSKEQRAQAELPDKVDTDRDSGLLSSLGVDIPALLSKFGGEGLAGGLGGLLGR